MLVPRSPARGLAVIMASARNIFTPAADIPLSARLSDATLLRTEAFVAGKFVATGGTFDVTDPATGAVVASVAACGSTEVDAAIVAADEARVAWARKTAKERGSVLRRWCDLMEANAPDIATILTIEAGKPYAEALGEVAYAASFFEWFAEEAKRMRGETIPATADNRR